jgi:hypothetical protein
MTILKHFNNFTLSKAVTDELRSAVNHTGRTVIELSNILMKCGKTDTMFHKGSFISETLIIKEKVI